MEWFSLTMKLNYFMRDQDLESPADGHPSSDFNDELSWVGWASVSLPESPTQSIGSPPLTPPRAERLPPFSLMVPSPWTPPRTPSIPPSPLEGEAPHLGNGKGLGSSATVLSPDWVPSHMVSHLRTPPRERVPQQPTPAGCLHCRDTTRGLPPTMSPRRPRSPSTTCDLHSLQTTPLAALNLNWVPPELLLRIASFLPTHDPTALMAFANTCRTFRSMLLNDRPLVRRCLRVDLTPFGSILDDDRLAIVIRNRFQPLDAPPTMRLGWVRELDLSETRVRTLDALIAPVANGQAPSHEGQQAAQLPGLRFVDLSKASEFFPAQRFRLCHNLTPPSVWMAHLRSLSLAHTVGLTDVALHTLIHHLSPHLTELNLEYCDHISDRGVACLMTAVQKRRGNMPFFDKLKLTGCVRLEGHYWAAIDAPVRRLWLDLTSMTDESLTSLIGACAGRRQERVLEWVNARACGFVLDGATIKEAGLRSAGVIVLV